MSPREPLAATEAALRAVTGVASACESEIARSCSLVTVAPAPPAVNVIVTTPSAPVASVAVTVPDETSMSPLAIEGVTGSR